MLYFKNQCTKCQEEWEVDRRWAKLDEIDHENLKNHGQLFGICEDCSSDKEYESVLV